MDIQKIRELSDGELLTEQGKAAEQMFRIRFQKSLGNQEGLKNLRSLKLDVARMKTVLRDRAISAARAEATSTGSEALGAGQREARKSNKKAL